MREQLLPRGERGATFKVDGGKRLKRKKLVYRLEGKGGEVPYLWSTLSTEKEYGGLGRRDIPLVRFGGFRFTWNNGGKKLQ